MRSIVTVGLLAFAPLLFAQQPPQAAGETDKCAIEGRVVHYVTGKPVPQAIVRLRETSQSQTAALPTVRADDEGRFSFADLESGSYTLHAEKRGFLNQAYGARSRAGAASPLKLVSGQRIRDLEFRLTPQAVVTGKVLDDRGEPVERASVSLLRDRRGLWGRDGAGTTNDLGEFRMSGISPGRYFLGASMSSGSTPAPTEPGKREEVFLPTLYPSARSVDSAVPLEIGPGQELSGITVSLGHSPVYRIRGRIAGQTGARIVVTLSPRERAFGSEAARHLFAFAASLTANPDGSFQIRGVRPGSYYLRASGRIGDSLQTSEDLPVEVTSEDIDVKELTVSLREMAVVAGTVRVEGDDRRVLTSIGVLLRQAGFMGSSPRTVSPRPDGSFRITDPASPGLYYVQLLQLPPDLYVKSVRMGDQEVRESGLELTGNQAVAIAILLGAKPATVTGTVKLDDKAAAGIWVALVPAEYVPGGPTELRTATSDLDGRVRFTGVPPGEYRRYAWEEEQYTPDLDANFLKPFQGNSAKVSAKEGDSIQVEVTAVPAEGSAAR